MSKKKKSERPKGKGDGKSETRQVAVRFPVTLADRLEAAAANLGLDVSNLLRMMVIENLPEYEARGEAAQAQLRRQPHAANGRLPD